MLIVTLIRVLNRKHDEEIENKEEKVEGRKLVGYMEPGTATVYCYNTKK
jgi:hypothetical protein